MNAINFIKQHGVEKARDVVEGAPAICTYVEEYPLGVRYYRSDIGFNMAIKISDIKRLVESVDLIGEYGGLYGAIDFISGYTEEQLAKPIYSPMLRLKQAIADYESIGGEHV